MSRNYPPVLPVKETSQSCDRWWGNKGSTDLFSLLPILPPPHRRRFRPLYSSSCRFDLVNVDPSRDRLLLIVHVDVGAAGRGESTLF